MVLSPDIHGTKSNTLNFLSTELFKVNVKNEASEGRFQNKPETKIICFIQILTSRVLHDALLAAIVRMRGGLRSQYEKSNWF